MHARMRLDSNRSCRRGRASTLEAPTSVLSHRCHGYRTDNAARFFDHPVNVDNAATPRMEGLMYLALFGSVGVLSLRCTTPTDPTAP